MLSIYFDGPLGVLPRTCGPIPRKAHAAMRALAFLVRRQRPLHQHRLDRMETYGVVDLEAASERTHRSGATYRTFLARNHATMGAGDVGSYQLGLQRRGHIADNVRA